MRSAALVARCASSRSSCIWPTATGGEKVRAWFKFGSSDEKRCREETIRLLGFTVITSAALGHPPDAEPVGRYDLLSLEIHGAVVDLLVQVVLDVILFMKPGRRAAGPAHRFSIVLSPPSSKMSTRRDRPILEAIGSVVLSSALIAIAPGRPHHLCHRARVPARPRPRRRAALGVGGRVGRGRRVRDGLALALRCDRLDLYMLVAVVVSAVVLTARFGVHARREREMLREHVP
jgi:hypothetical protein